MHFAIIPPNSNLMNNRIFDLDSDRDNIFSNMVQLKKYFSNNDTEVHTIDKFAYNEIDFIYFQNLLFALNYLLKVVKHNPKVIIIYHAAESPLILSLNNKPFLDSILFDYIITWNDKLIDNDRYIENRSFANYERMIKPEKFVQKKLLCAIYSNKQSKRAGELYSLRKELIRYFANKKMIDLYGYGWSKEDDENIRMAYLGTTKSKVETFNNYKFAISFENSLNDLGGISEKIFDIFFAGCIPIYFGSPNVHNYVPSNCFIDFRDFDRLTELEEYLCNMKENKYKEYINNIDSFLRSERFRKFSHVAFIESINLILRNKIDVHKNLNSIKLDLISKILSYPRIFLENKRILIKIVKTLFI